MNADDAVTLQARNHLTAGILQLNHDWGVLQAEHLVMPRPKPYDFSLHSGRHYLALLNARRKDGETTVDDLPRSTLRDIRGKLTFVPAGCRLQGWSLPGTTPIAFTAAYLDPEVCSQLDTGETQLYPMLHFEHPLLTQLMLQLDRILAQPENYSRVYVESFAVVLLAEIMHCQAVDLSRSRRAERRLPAKGGRAGRLAAQGRVRLHRGKPASGHLAGRAGGDRPTKPVSFLPGVQAIGREAAAPLSNEPPDRAGQGIAG
jgi:AraC family transcriptional regulator